MVAKQMNGSRLKAIAESSDTATIIMTHLALRQRHRPFTDIVRLKKDLWAQGEQIVDADANRLFQLLQAEGIGTVVYGDTKRTKEVLQRFVWNFSLIDIGKLALNGGVGSVELVSDGDLKRYDEKVSKEPKVPNIVKIARAKLEAQNEPFLEPKLTQRPMPQQFVETKPAVRTMGSVMKPSIETAAPISTRVSSPNGNMQRILIPLRPDVMIQVKLPHDITESEIELVANCLRQSIG